MPMRLTPSTPLSLLYPDSQKNFKTLLIFQKKYAIISPVAQNTERYRSGHNGADSKSVCAKAHEGSNPSLSAIKSLAYARLFSFLCYGQNQQIGFYKIAPCQAFRFCQFSHNAEKSFYRQNFNEMCCFLVAFRAIMSMCAWRRFLVRLLIVAQYPETRLKIHDI